MKEGSVPKSGRDCYCFYRFSLCDFNNRVCHYGEDNPPDAIDKDNTDNINHFHS